MRTYVMVAEGDPELARVITETFESCDYEVKRVTSLEEALGEIETRAPDVLVVSDDFSECRGAELCRKLQEGEAETQMPSIILLTDKTKPQEIIGLTRSVNLWMRRPVDPILLESAVESLLQRKRRHAPANPLTRLPGRATLDKELDRRRAASESFCVCSFKLLPDSAAAFRKKYGEVRFAALVRQAARSIFECAAALPERGAFVAHVGTSEAPEFVALVPPNRARHFCFTVCDEFEVSAELLYDMRERTDGFITVTDERGNKERARMVAFSSEISEETPQHQTSFGSRP